MLKPKKKINKNRQEGLKRYSTKRVNYKESLFVTIQSELDPLFRKLSEKQLEDFYTFFMKHEPPFTLYFSFTTIDKEKRFRRYFANIMVVNTINQYQIDFVWNSIHDSFNAKNYILANINKLKLTKFIFAVNRRLKRSTEMDPRWVDFYRQERKEKIERVEKMVSDALKDNPPTVPIEGKDPKEKRENMKAFIIDVSNNAIEKEKLEFNEYYEKFKQYYLKLDYAEDELKLDNLIKKDYDVARKHEKHIKIIDFYTQVINQTDEEWDNVFKPYIQK